MFHKFISNNIKSFEVLEGSAMNHFWTDYFEMNFEISVAGMVNFET